MRASLQHQLEHVNFSKAEVQQFWQHMHFATTSVAETGHWVQGLLAEWTSPRKVITVSTQPGRPVMSVPSATADLVVISQHEHVARTLMVTSQETSPDIDLTVHSSGCWYVAPCRWAGSDSNVTLFLISSDNVSSLESVACCHQQDCLRTT